MVKAKILTSLFILFVLKNLRAEGIGIGIELSSEGFLRMYNETSLQAVRCYLKQQGETEDSKHFSSEKLKITLMNDNGAVELVFWAQKGNKFYREDGTTEITDGSDTKDGRNTSIFKSFKIGQFKLTPREGLTIYSSLSGFLTRKSVPSSTNDCLFEIVAASEQRYQNGDFGTYETDELTITFVTSKKYNRILLI